MVMPTMRGVVSQTRIADRPTVPRPAGRFSGRTVVDATADTLARIEAALQRPAFAVDRQTLIANEPIRDTLTHGPAKMVSLEQADTWSFLVVNGSNQTVTVQMIGNFTASVDGTSTLGPAQTVAARGRTSFSVDAAEFWTPWIGMQASYTTAPTEGSLSVLIAVRNKV